MSRIEEQLADLLSRTGVGSWHWDHATGRVVWDEALEQLFGLDPGSFEGTFDAWAAKLHPDDAGSVLEAVERSMETRSPLFFDHRCIWPDGSEHWLEARGYPLMNDIGEVIGAAGVAIDISSRMQAQDGTVPSPDSGSQTSVERAWERLAQLQVIAVRLAGAAGVEDVGRVLVDQGSRAIGAQGGFFSIVNRATGSLQLRAWRGARDDVIEFYRDVPLEADNPASFAARTGEAVRIQNSTQRAERFPGLPHQGAEAFWIQPIVVEGDVKAVLGYGYVDAHVFSRDEEELIATIAGMSSESLRRAALHDDVERTARRSAQLESAIAELAAAELRHDVARTVVESLIPAVGAQKGSLFIVDEPNGILTALAIHGYPGETVERYKSLDLDASTGPTDVARNAEPLIINGKDDFAVRYPHLATDVGIGSLPATSLMLPLIVESHVIGTMSLGWDKTHHFTEDELRHLTIVGGICAHALGRANAFENWQNAHARLRSIDQITDAALSELSLEDLLEVLPERIAGAMGAVATRIFLVDESGQYLEARGSHGAPSEGLARVPVGRGLAGTIASTGGPRLVENIRSVDVVRPAFPDEVVWEAGVPLKADNQVIGVLDVGSGADRPLTQADIELLERAADRIATAISRSRAYELERAARRRSEFIGRLGEIVSGPGGLKEQMEEMARLTATTLADCCVMAVLDEGGAVVSACAHADPQLEATGRLLVDEWIYHPAAPEGIAAVIQSGRSQHYGVLEDDSPDLPAAFIGKLYEELGLGSAIITPLAGVSGPVGAMVLGRVAGGPGLTPDDMALAEDLAARVAAVVAGRLAFDRHRNTAITLQRSLLPSSLPRIDGLDVAARYWPASQAADVGGDFYDVVELGPDAWAVIVGDVSGKGVEASAMTGIARHTARAAARHGLGPSEVLRWIHDAFLDQAETTGSFCTAVVGLLTQEGEDFRFRFAVGGHPLPVLRRNGQCAYIGEPGTVLGLVDPVQIVDSEVTLGDDDSLLIYTDGVTDVPVPNAVTEEELLAIVAQWDDRTAAEGVAALDQVLEDRYGGTPSRDDTAVLFIRRRPTRSGAAE